MPTGLVTLPADASAYGSADEAVRALASGIPSDKNAPEQAGIVYRGPDGKYYASTLSSQTDHDAFQMHAAVPHGYSIAALFHNHPGIDEDAGMFSQQDIDVANHMKLPSYIRFMKDDSIRRFTPNQTQVKPYYSQMQGWVHVTPGDPVPATPQQATAANATPAVPVPSTTPTS